MPSTPLSARLRAAEIWVVLGLLILLNVAFVAGIHWKVVPFKFYAYGRFVLLGLGLALLVTLFRGPRGALALVGSMAVWRVAPGWYLLAASWAPLMCVTTLLAKGLSTGFQVLRADLGIFTQPAVMTMILVGSFIGEIVWVAYAINRLAGRFTVLVASLIVGIFWTLWWMPIVRLGVGVIPGLPFGALLVNMLGVAAMCGFIYARTRSGPVVLTLQVMLNSSLLVFPVLPASGGLKTYWLFAVVYLLAALGMHIAFGPRPLFRVGKGAGAAQAEAPGVRVSAGS
jgi:membrane protease YdiL (CAAX protease family)